MSSERSPLNQGAVETLIIVKALLFLVAAAAGSGLFFHQQLQGWLHLPGTRPGTGEVFYLRSGCRSTNPDGKVVRWSPGQQLKTTTQASAAEGSLALTDGVNTLQVPRDAVTQDANFAETLRRTEAANRDAAQEMAEQDAARQTYEDDLARLQSQYARQPSVVAPTTAYYPVYILSGTPAPAQMRQSATDRKHGPSRSRPPKDRPKPTPAGSR